MIEKVVDLLKGASYAIAFTGAGISVESGIPPFRGSLVYGIDITPNYWSWIIF